MSGCLFISATASSGLTLPSGLIVALLKSKFAPGSSAILVPDGGGGGGGAGFGSSGTGSQIRRPSTAPRAAPPTTPPAIAPARSPLLGSSATLLVTTPPVMPPTVAPIIPPAIAQDPHSRFLNEAQPDAAMAMMRLP